jgi:hypothetical protein
MSSKVTAIVVVGCAWITLAPAAISQERAADQRLHIRAPWLGLGANVIADSIERDAPTLKWSPSVLRLKGNVEIRRIITIGLPQQEGQDNSKAGRAYLIVRADEADYREDTAEITPRGNVHVSIQPIE